MRVEYINPFVEATVSVLQQYIGPVVKRGNLYLKSTSKEIMGVAALVGLAGDVEGRVLLDMTKETALKVASVMNGEEMKALDDMTKATITELANQIAAQAISSLYEANYKFDLTPPTIFTGDNMMISSNMNVEALIVPVELGASGENGKIEINVVIRERA